MRPFQTLCKLLQRQTYSCLSTRSGMWFCLGGLIIMGISAFQFGELLLEWSMQKYNIAFSASHDNIAGKGFQSRLCLPGPIDVVYTWVNGSDPDLIAELNFVKSELMSKLNLTKNFSENNGQSKKLGAAKPTSRQRSNSEEKFQWRDENECPFPNCVPFNAIAVSGLPRNISEFELSIENMFLPGFQFSTFDNSVDASVKVLNFGNSFNFDKIKNHTINLKGKEKKFSRVFVSSTIRVGAKKLDGIGMINYLSKDITVELIKNALYKEKVGDVSVSIVRSTSVIKFDNLAKSRQFLHVMRGRILIKGNRFKVLPATLIWKPLTSLEIQQSIIEEDVGSSRFADNEELRYSMRSLEKYAPWVRNIFIVTNGQIPSWLNLDHPRIKIITHEELFSNTSHLPTFSSPAIETHIHKIPGLSKKFIYMNDDVFFGDYVWPDDFYTHSKGQKIYLTWPVPNCNEGCPASWVNDKYCDKPCNVSECDWDGGDCLNPKGRPGFSTYLHMYSTSHIANQEYCNGGCANSWIGDRYCDVNCNVPNCGFDAGDCGPDKLKGSFAIDAENIKGTVYVPVGATAFYVNFTNVLNGGVLTDGTYADSDIVRTAIFSKKFKTMAVTIYKNFTSTIHFHVSGFKDSNHSIPVSLNFSVTVDTTKEEVGTTQRTTTRLSVESVVTTKSLPKSYTLYDAGAKEQRLSASTKKPLFDNKTVSEILGWYEFAKREIPAELAEQLNKTETELKDGDITEKGYIKRKFQILHPFYESSHHSMESNQGQHQRTKRHLLSHFDFQEGSYMQPQKPVVIEKADRSQKSKHVKIVSCPTVGARDKTRSKKGTRDGVLSLKRWISKYGHWDPIKEAFSTSPHRWERQNIFAEILSEYRHLKRQREYRSERRPTRKLLDTFASSLLHVSRIYNRAFGYEARKVPAHMPHFVDIDLINEMQTRFWPHFEETSSHKIRMENDMQFAFSYSYYLMDVPASVNISMVFDELDIDATNTLSERELRTLAAQMNSLPLQASDVRNLEEVLLNCSKSMKTDDGKPAEFPSLIVTRDLVTNCQPIARALMGEMKQKRYKFELVGDEDVTFKMIRNNVSHLIYQLDWIRKNRRKFVCLNDNIDHDNPQSKLIRTVLRDFLEYLFPQPSQFELPSGFRNRYLKISELRKWKEKAIKDQEEIWIFVYVILLFFLLLLLRRQVFRLYRIIIDCFSRPWTSYRGLNFNRTEIVKI